MFAFELFFFHCKPAFAKSPAIGMLLDCVAFTINNNKTSKMNLPKCNLVLLVIIKMNQDQFGIF